MTVSEPSHAVAVFGGACAGSVVADLLAKAGVQVVVFDQNKRPYGKIEDGLPRWHAKQRTMEYGKIDERLDQPNVTFVPSTKLGVDLGFDDVARDWGWSAVILANGAWDDRELAADGAEAAVDHGLVYQNPFIYWFNHKNEASYDGPQFDVQDGCVVVGGGLASIDVIKVVQMELYQRALKERGIESDMHEMEEKGIPKYLAEKGIDDPASLGVKGGTLIYRRRVADMPLASAPPNAKQKVIDKIPLVRKKILDKCLKKFLFTFQAQTVTKALVLEGGELTGITVQKTEVEGRKAIPIEGSDETIATKQVISSIGSIPQPIPGVDMKGAYYTFKDWDTGEYANCPGVFGSGNVVTGQGNIKASLEHGRFVADHVLENYLGVGEGERDISEALAKGDAKGEATAAAVSEHLATKDKLPAERVNALLERAAARQKEVGYGGDFKAWIKSVTPPDME